MCLIDNKSFFLLLEFLSTCYFHSNWVSAVFSVGSVEDFLRFFLTPLLFIIGLITTFQKEFFPGNRIRMLFFYVFFKNFAWRATCRVDYIMRMIFVFLFSFDRCGFLNFCYFCLVLYRSRFLCARKTYKIN